jgi:hypothetical protein
MTLSPRITAADANAMLNNSIGGGLADAGLLLIYSGTQPAAGGGALSGNTLLATLTMGSPAFGSASAGVLTANNITSATAIATGAASWFRLTKADGVTVLLDGSIGTAGCDLNLSSTSIISGGTVTVTTFSITMPQL